MKNYLSSVLFLLTLSCHLWMSPPDCKSTCRQPMIFLLYQHIVTELICRGIWHQKVIQWPFFRLDPSHGKKFYDKTNKVVTMPKDQQESDSYIFAQSLSCHSFHILKSISFILSFISISFILLIIDSSHSFAFTIFLYTHTIPYFSLNVSFIFQPILFLETRSNFRSRFNLKYIFYHLKLNCHGSTTPCYFKRMTTQCQSKTTHAEDSQLHSRFMWVVLINIYTSLIICYLLLHHGQVRTLQSFSFEGNISHS